MQGTKGIVRKYPEEKVYIEGRSPRAHTWEDFGPYAKEYKHPARASIEEKAKGAGHGGMDFVEDYRLINALRQGIWPDIDVYDSVSWSAIIPLSIESVKQGGAPVQFPDFMRGRWQEKRPLGVFAHML